jgi:ribosome maturation factor RimP
MSPLLFLYMLALNTQIEEWVQPKLDELGCFLVQVEMCEKVSRHLEFYLDTADEVPKNYNLEVSSPGMDNPLLVEKQFIKNLGRNVEVLMSDGVKKEGVLKQYGGGNLTLEIWPEPKKKGQKPEPVAETIALDKIKYTKKKISF